MKVTDQPVVTIGKVILKEGAGKVGSYTRPLCMVQLILEQLANGTFLAVISPNIASRAALTMPGVDVIVKELPVMNFIWSYRTIIGIIGETLTAYRIEKVEQWD